MEQLDFQIMLTDNYYVNANSMHLSFLMKIKQLSNEANDIESDLVTANNFFPHLMKEIGNDKQLRPTFSPNQTYQYSDAMLNHLPKNFLKKLKKQCFTAKSQFILTKQHWIEDLIIVF